MHNKILVVTDFDSVGSGYKYICAPLLTGLANLGYDIKVAGLNYKGDEHSYPFSIIPAQNFQDAHQIAQNLIYLWHPDVVLVALDLPLQAQYFSQFAPLLNRIEPEVKEGITTSRKYICVTPLENGPLTMSWATSLYNMDAVFFISELGKQEALKVGIGAEHLVVGVDTESWKPPTVDERIRLREGLGFPSDAFVILTVAENQERKNLWAGMASVCLLTHDTMTRSDFELVMRGDKRANEFPKTRSNVRYVMVTRENNPFGWRLRDLAVQMDINQEYISFERGLPRKDLWGLYAMSDVYMQPSKAEGLGLPVLDAMAGGIVVVATRTGAMQELLEDGRGYLIEPEYEFIDVWGNSKRSMMDIDMASMVLRELADGTLKKEDVVQSALEYSQRRTWDIAVGQIHNKIEELYGKD